MKRHREDNHYSVNHSLAKKPKLKHNSVQFMNDEYDGRTSNKLFKFEAHPTKSDTQVISLVDSLSPSNSIHSDTNSLSTETVETVSSDLYEQDAKGYLVFVEGLLIANKYKLLKQLGKGTFSRVFECYQVDVNRNKKIKHKNRSKLAIKVIRNQYKYQMAAKTELQVLNTIRDNDPNDTSCCIHIRQFITWRGHPIFVFPLYGPSLYSFMVRNKYKPFCYRHAIHLMYQLCRGVAYIHSLNIIITDLKPENIVLVYNTNATTMNRLYSYPPSTKIKLIDFGSAVLNDENNAKHSHLIQTRHYRSPEVVFKLAWSFSSDIWSIGCILVELIYGKMLFNTHCSIDHLNQIVKCIDAPDASLLELIDDETWKNYFDSRGALNMYKAKRSPVQCRRLDKYFRDKDKNTQCAQLYDLCTRLLCWDPKKRWTAKQALTHPVFTQCIL
eukprot:254519_1